MIRLYRVVGAAFSVNWVVGQFPDEKHAVNEYNSEVRRAESEGIDDGRPELEFAARDRDVEYYLVEEEVTHTETRRDESMETGRWGLVSRRKGT